MTNTQLFWLTFWCGVLVALTVQACYRANQLPWHELEHLLEGLPL